MIQGEAATKIKREIGQLVEKRNSGKGCESGNGDVQEACASWPRTCALLQNFSAMRASLHMRRMLGRTLCRHSKRSRSVG